MINFPLKLACILDIMRSLEVIDIVKSGSPDMILPSAGSSIEKDLMAKLSLSRRPFQSTIHLGDLSHAMHMLFQILETLLPLEEEKLDHFSAAGITQDFTAVLKLTARAWKCLSSVIKRYGAVSRRNIVDPVVRYLYFNQLLVQRSLKADSIECLDAQASKIFNESLAVILSDPTLSHDPKIEQVLQYCLESLREFQDVSPAIRVNVQGIFIPRAFDLHIRNSSHLQVSHLISSKIFRRLF
jgi:serine/threonine-protein kinase ATR